MRIQFTHTQEDIVDASQRFYARSKVVSGLRRSWAVWSAIIAGVFILVLFRFSLVGLVGGAAAALICVIIFPWIYGHEQRKSHRKLLRESYGEENNFVCQVELLPDALKTRTANIESTTTWETVEEIVETSDSVDIFTRRGGVIVRNRAFSSAEERQEFINLAREYLSQARALAKK